MVFSEGSRMGAESARAALTAIESREGDGASHSSNPPMRRRADARQDESANRRMTNLAET
jgi:hypothetical protein